MTKSFCLNNIFRQGDFLAARVLNQIIDGHLKFYGRVVKRAKSAIVRHTKNSSFLARFVVMVITWGVVKGASWPKRMEADWTQAVLSENARFKLRK